MVIAFTDLELQPALLRSLSDLGYEEPTPIQAQAIPVQLTGADVLAQAATGTGKTAAFALPILQKLEPGRREPQALVLVPTRELALQVSQAFHRYGRDLGVRVLAVYGGAPIRHQIQSLQRGVDVVVATPGRALDLMDRGVLVAHQVHTVVLDEADEMLDMGFQEDLESLLSRTPAERQTVLFSATLPKRIDKLAARHLREPRRISIKAEQPAAHTPPRVRQTAYIVTRPHKALALGRILDTEDPAAAIVFCRTRGGVDELTDLLTSSGYQAEALHGGLTQDQRDRVMSRLRGRSTEILVATDVAARGLDVEHLTHVVNFDLPTSAEDYVHRVGRVGRAGREGVAISLVEPRERRMLGVIEKATDARIQVAQVPSVSDVHDVRRQRTLDSVRAVMEEGHGRVRAYEAMAESLTAEGDAREALLAALALLHESSQSATSDDTDLSVPAYEEDRAKKKRSKSTDTYGAKTGSARRADGARDAGHEGSTRLFVSLGRKAGVTPGDLVGAITGEAGIKGRDIGAITMHEMYSLVEVPEGKARKIAKALNHCTIRGRKATVRLDRG